MKRTNLRDAHQRGQYVTDLDAQYRRGLLSHQELLRLQNAAMPTCDVCGKQPCTHKNERRGYVCNDCYEQQREERL